MLVGKRIFRLTFSTFMGPFMATFFVVLFTLLIQFLWKYIDDMVGKGIEWWIILELMFYASASFVPLALPLSILLSAIMAFGKMSETYELVAFKSAGVSLVRLMLPMVLVTVGFSIAAFFFANNFIPSANLKFHSLLYDIRQQRPALDIREGVFYNGIDNYSIRVQRKDKESRKIWGIMIYDHSQGRGSNVVMTAKSGEMYTTDDERFLVINLIDGARFEELDNRDPAKPTFPFMRQSFKSYGLKFDLTAFKLARTKEELFKDHYEMLNLSQLQFYEDSLDRVVEGQRRQLVDYIKPYISALRDTNYHDKARPAFQPVPKGQPFLHKFPAEQRPILVSNALISARTVKGIMEEQGRNLDVYEKLATRYEIEWHRKFTLSLACMVLFFIGAPLGAIIRKGGIGLPTVVAIFIFLVYYIITIIGEKSAKQGATTAFIGMWLPYAILMPIGFFLTYRANQDSISFNFDRLTRKLRRIFRRKTKQHIYHPHAHPPAK